MMKQDSEPIRLKYLHTFSNEPLEALIFDLDGVILNSEEFHARAKRLTMMKYNIEFPESIFDEYKGRTDRAFFAYVSHVLAGDKISGEELAMYKRNVYIDIFHLSTLIPGSMEYMVKARKVVRNMGLVSSATRADLDIAEMKFQIKKWFDQIILGDETAKHKPHPEPYNKVLAALGVNASNVLVIEDSPNGIISAKEAGCEVIGITTSFEKELLLNAGADLVIDGFKEILPLIEKRLSH
jgi:beta-phosphoglucomutase